VLKIGEHDIVNVRPARSGDSPLMTVTIPKQLVEVMKLKKGKKLRIYTDGERIYLDRFEQPTI
jgi:antitoxin component of MazEF toxin-antitoxin module